jgi:hypothetical protein
VRAKRGKASRGVEAEEGETEASELTEDGESVRGM